MKKKFVLWGAVLSLLLCSPGCTASWENTEPNRSVLPESLQSKDFSTPMTISIGYWDIEDMSKISEPDEMQTYIEELFNIKISPVSVTWSNYKERYQILTATDSLPDIFATVTISSSDNNDSATFIDMIENQAIRPLPDDLSAYPILNEMLKNTSGTKYTDGKYYAIPRFSFLDPQLGATDAAMLVRRDWMENLGYEDPQSFEEFVEMTAAFAKDDPDGNGIADTIGYNVNNVYALGKWVILGIAPACNVYSWIEQDGYYIPCWITEDFERVVSAYRTLYQSGSLDPDFYSKSPTTAVEDFAAGRLGALEYKSSPSSLKEIKNKWDLLNDQPFEECVDVLPIFPAPDGVRYSNYSTVFWSEMFMSSSVDDKKAERILSLFEYLLSDNGQILCNYGLEKSDYVIDDTGAIECLLDVGEGSLSYALLEKYPSSALFSSLVTWGGSWNDFEETELNYLKYGESCVKLAKKSATWYAENTTQITRPTSFLLYPKEPTDLFSTYEAFDDFIACIIGSEDPVEMWRSSLDKMYEQGLEEYIRRQNENYQVYMAKMS